jgi:D-serine deaminase-like pyridoxal phosphate-dependent protein
MLGRCGTPDVLFAYQPTGPKLRRFAALIKNFPATKFSCVTDNPATAKDMAAFFDANGLVVSVYIDINSGMNRTGIAPGEEAVQLYILCSGLKGIKPIGWHHYDGHIRDADILVRKQQCDAAFEQVKQISAALIANGFAEPIIIAGGSPSFSIHCKREKVECSPGTFIYWDKGYIDLCPEQSFVPAALVITRVISLPDATKLCLDLGHKSVAAENELSRRVYFLNAPQLNFVSHSEEHLVVDAGQGHHYKIGDILYGLPLHICPTVALYERALVVENGHITGEWKTIARDRKLEY